MSWYDTIYSARQNKYASGESELPEDDVENNDDTISESESENENKSKIIEFKDGTSLKKRSRQKVLRYNKVSENENKEEHYIQLLMLFTSWINEECDLMNKCNSFYESYHKMEDVILLNQQKYEKIDQQLLEKAITEYSEDFENSIRDPVLPQIDHQELIDTI